MSTTTERAGAWVATYTGRQFWPLDVRPEDLVLDDIAHALALQCRFNGHVREFYSVAEHSVRVSWVLEQGGQPVEIQLWGLLHDAPEAYIGDMVRPLKKSPGMEAYCRVDDEMLAVVAERFGLSLPVPAAVWQADDALLHAEARDLLNPCPDRWWSDAHAHPVKIAPVSPGSAEFMFVERFTQLTAKRS